MNHILKTENLTIKYGEKEILSNINININAGEFVGIIGPNGAGKSTLIKAITDIIEVKEGSIIIDGMDNKKISKRELAKLVAVVPQEFSIDFEFDAFDIVMMGRNPHKYGKTKDEANDAKVVREAMIMTNTWQFKERFFNQLSGGERQRIIIARAIAQQTKIILLDEPTSHLDIHHQLEVLELARMLKEKHQITIVAVLHDINMASRFSDKLILLNDKSVMVYDVPEEVIDEKYLTKVYDMEMIIRKNNVLSVKEIIPIRVLKETLEDKTIKVHVVSGGGSGEQILEKLNSMGFSVSCGVISHGDSDWNICKLLNIDIAEVLPFSDISEEAIIKNKTLIENSDIVLITDVPFGPANVVNLEMLLETDKNVYVLKSRGEFDYTDGKARKILKEIENCNRLVYVDSYNEFIDIVKKAYI